MPQRWSIIDPILSQFPFLFNFPFFQCNATAISVFKISCRGETLGTALTWNFFHCSQMELLMKESSSSSVSFWWSSSAFSGSTPELHEKVACNTSKHYHTQKHAHKHDPMHTGFKRRHCFSQRSLKIEKNTAYEHIAQLLVLTLSLPSSKSKFSQPFKEKCISEVVRNC